MRNNIVQITDLDTPTLSRFSSGFAVPVILKMHYGSAGGGAGDLDWQRYIGAENFSNEQLAQLVHYEEALPCLDAYNFESKSILVIGSSVPWLECYLARRGAARVTTVEYREIRWTPSFPETAWQSITFDRFLSAAPDQHDLVISYSSIEHSGLGRYQDAISPDGDLETLFVARRWMRPDAAVLIAVPVGPDLVCFNRHRVYGPNRIKIMAEILQTEIKGVIRPAYPYGDRSPSDALWALDYAFEQPLGYDQQLLIEFGNLS
jgi:hypothetical protein